MCRLRCVPRFDETKIGHGAAFGKGAADHEKTMRYERAAPLILRGICPTRGFSAALHRRAVPGAQNRAKPSDFCAEMRQVCFRQFTEKIGTQLCEAQIFRRSRAPVTQSFSFVSHAPIPVSTREKTETESKQQKAPQTVV